MNVTLCERGGSNRGITRRLSPQLHADEQPEGSILAPVTHALICFICPTSQLGGRRLASHVAEQNAAIRVQEYREATITVRRSSPRHEVATSFVAASKNEDRPGAAYAREPSPLETPRDEVEYNQSANPFTLDFLALSSPTSQDGR
jgi:hypothetical protein